MAYSLLPARSLAGEVSQLLTQMVTDFNSDIRLDFFSPPQLPKRRDDIVFPPDVLMYMCKAILNKEEEECRMDVTSIYSDALDLQM